MTRTKTNKNRARTVREIEETVALLDRCLEVSQRKKLKTAELYICMAQLELRKKACMLLDA